MQNTDKTSTSKHQSIASELLEQHVLTLVDDNAKWQTLIADEIVWELAYAPSVGHPAKLTGREEVMNHVNWFLGAVENFRFFDLKINAFANPDMAVAQVNAEGIIKPTGRTYQQEYVVFIRTENGKITFIREYFDPIRAARAMDLSISGVKL